MALDDEVLEVGFGARRARQLSRKYAILPDRKLAKLYSLFQRAQRLTERRLLIDRLIVLRSDFEKKKSHFAMGQGPLLSQLKYFMSHKFYQTMLACICLCGCISQHTSAQTELEYNDARIVAVYNTLVASEAPGVIRTIDIAAGDEVQKQAVLATLNSETFQADVDVALAEEQIARLQAANHAQGGIRSKVG